MYSWWLNSLFVYSSFFLCSKFLVFLCFVTIKTLSQSFLLIKVSILHGVSDSHFNFSYITTIVVFVYPLKFCYKEYFTNSSSVFEDLIWLLELITCLHSTSSSFYYPLWHKFLTLGLLLLYFFHHRLMSVSLFTPSGLLRWSHGGWWSSCSLFLGVVD